MTVQLDWPPDVVARLQQEAAQSGHGLGDYLLQSVLSNQPAGLAAPSPTDPEEANRTRLCREAGDRIREFRATNILGPELTVRDLIEEGRRF
ncbi:MAG: hypothetical protein EBY17_29205 [Acidobacteriia bacterium]|nr:hypothetical protein [Terriglobia bacterium]